MKAGYKTLVAGLLMAAALPVAAQQSTLVATGKVEAILVGENDTGHSVDVFLSDNGGQKFGLLIHRNLARSPGPPMLQMLLKARETGAKVRLLCSATCDPRVFDSLSVD